MSNQSLDLKNIQTILDLKTAIDKFSEGIQSDLKYINNEIGCNFEWLLERSNYWQHEIEIAQQDLYKAEADLQRCENSGIVDEDGYYHQPYCDCEKRTVEQASAYLHECNEAIQIVQKWQGRIEKAASDQITAANQLSTLSDWQSEKAQMNLDQTACRYEIVQSTSSQVGSIGNLLGGLVESVNAGIAAHGNNQGDWKDRNIQNIYVDNLPYPDEIKNGDDFKKVSLEEMKAGLNRLQEIRPIVEKGTGNSSDYWAKIDQQKGLNFSSGYQRIYDAFYGQDAIRVEKNGNTFDIINGRHRIWLAKQMGIEQLPIHLIEKM